MYDIIRSNINLSIETDKVVNVPLTGDVMRPERIEIYQEDEYKFARLIGPVLDNNYNATDNIAEVGISISDHHREFDGDLLWSELPGKLRKKISQYLKELEYK